jgi:ABC-2 type transport system permease protein
VKGICVIARKELADHFGSARFTILFLLILMMSIVMTYMVGTAMKTEMGGALKPTFTFLLLFTLPGKFISLIEFFAIFGPIIGIILGFDAINRERNARTLSKLASQPIYRDNIINGKFLAGLITIIILHLAILLLISGLGLLLIGVVPSFDEVGRLAVYCVVSVLHTAFWLGIAIFFSVTFRSMATSSLAAIACWIFSLFFIPMAAGVIADVFAPVEQSRMYHSPELFVKHEQVKKTIAMVSPMRLYSEATSVILDPMRKTTQSVVLMGPFERMSISRFQNPLPLGESFFIVLPLLITLVAITAICFAVCYAIFMREEIRST